MAKKKVTKAAELDTTNSLDTTSSVQEGVGELSTTVTKTEEIGNDSVQSEEIVFAESFAPEQSQSETDSTQSGVEGSRFGVNPDDVVVTLISTTPDGQTTLSEKVLSVDWVEAPKTSQEGALEGVAIGEPTPEQEQALNELVELSEEMGMYAEDSPVLIATDAEEEDDTIAPEPDVEFVAIEINGVDYVDCVGQVLYAGSLGAKINPNYRPQLKRVPYRVDLLLPIDMVDTFVNKTDVQEYDEGIQYNQASLSSLDVGRFVEQLLEAGEDGAILTPKKATNNFVTFAAALSNVAPFRDSATIQSAAVKRYYTYKELHEFNLNTLKIVASWYKVRKQPKWLMVQQILKAQRERQDYEERTKLDS